MKNAVKGALLSGLILPGLGQFVLKRRKRGAGIMLVVFASLAFIVYEVVQRALLIVDKLMTGTGDIGINDIPDAATHAFTASQSLALNAAFVIILGCWVLGIIDAYTEGRKIDRADSVSRLENNSTESE